MQSIAIQQLLLDKKISLFTPRELASLLQISPRTASYYLAKGVEEGLFLYLKRGLYGLKTHLPPEEVIANRLCRPSYVSFAYALGSYGILPEMSYQITSATPLTTRSYQVENISYHYHTIKQSAFTGYKLVTRGRYQFLMAEPEKALADWCYFVALGLMAPNDRLQLGSINLVQAGKYAQLFGPKTLAVLEGLA